MGDSGPHRKRAKNVDALWNLAVKQSEEITNLQKLLVEYQGPSRLRKLEAEVLAAVGEFADIPIHDGMVACSSGIYHRKRIQLLNAWELYLDHKGDKSHVQV